MSSTVPRINGWVEVRAVNMIVLIVNVFDSPDNYRDRLTPEFLIVFPLFGRKTIDGQVAH